MTKYLNPSPCWLIWDKIQEFSGAVFEMAWTSFKSPAKAFRMSRVEAYVNKNKIHPTQKPIAVLKRLIEIFTDPGDVVIDPCAGSGSTLRAAAEIGRRAYGFEVDKAIYQRAKEEMLSGLESLEQQITLQEVCGVAE